jgi:hypothetical protein
VVWKLINTIFCVIKKELSEVLTSAGLLRRRWQVKSLQTGHAAFTNQNLFGMTENAVMTYIWIAIAVNVLVAILKKHLHLGITLYTIREILSLILFKKRPFYRYRHLSTIQN